MQVQLTRWGNSLGMRIPKDLATLFRLSEGSQVDVSADGERIVISRIHPRYRLDDLVADLGHDDLRDAFDWGPDLGREVVE